MLRRWIHQTCKITERAVPFNTSRISALNTGRFVPSCAAQGGYVVIHEYTVWFVGPLFMSSSPILKNNSFFVF